MTTMATVEQQRQHQLLPNQSVLSKYQEQRRKSFQEPQREPFLRLVPPAFQTCIVSPRSSAKKSKVMKEIQKSPNSRKNTPTASGALSSPSCSGKRASWRQTSPRVNHKLTFQVLKEAAERARCPCAQQAAQEAKARQRVVDQQRNYSHKAATSIQAPPL